MDLTCTHLHSVRLTLTAFTPASAVEIFPCITASLTRFMTFEPASSPETFAAIWQAWLPKMAAGTEVFLVIRLTQTGEFLGLCGVHGLNRGVPELDRAEPEIGIWIKETAHGHGYGREAITTTLKWLNTVCGVPACVYSVAAANAASRRIPEALQAEQIGVHTLHKLNGDEHLLLVYRLSTA